MAIYYFFMFVYVYDGCYIPMMDFMLMILFFMDDGLYKMHSSLGYG